MGFTTKVQIDDQHVVQGTGTTLTLNSGSTTAYDGHPVFTGDTQVVDKKYVDDNVVSGSTYSLLSPAAIEVGGIPVDYVLTGKSSNCIIQDMLYPELCGTLTNACVSSFVAAPTTSIYEIGCSASITLTATFNQGCIDPQYQSLSDKRSGLPNTYCYDGPQIGPVSVASTSPTNATGVTSYTIAVGNNTWGVCVASDAGSPAISNKGNQFAAALGACTSPVVNRTVVGAYPLFATTSAIGTCTKQTLVDMSSANNIQYTLVTETGGDKQAFQIPCAMLTARSGLKGVCQFNTVSSQWEYPGGSAGASLALWDDSAATQTIQSASIGYCNYLHNGPDRESVQVRLVF